MRLRAAGRNRLSVVGLVTRPPEATSLVHWGALLGRARGEDVVVVVTAHGKGEARSRAVELDLAEEDALQGAGKVAAEAIRRVQGVLPGLPRPEGAEPSEPTFALLSLEGSDLEGTVLGVCREHESNLLLVGRRHKGDPDSPNAVLCRALFERAPCHTLLLRPGGDPAETAEKILVPTAGGPHATVALRLAAGSAVSLFAAGIRSKHLHRRQNKWARRAWITLFVLAAGTAILLAFWLASRAH